MKLSEFLSDIGRPVAYYPSLAHALGGVKQAVFLCQILYWTGKESNPDGWIYKTVEELEEETGLSYKEQLAARKSLCELGILEEWDQKLIHRKNYRVNREALDEFWENSRLTQTASPDITFGNVGRCPNSSSGDARRGSRYKGQRLQAENTSRDSPLSKSDSRGVAGVISNRTDSRDFAENESVASDLDGDWPFEE